MNFCNLSILRISACLALSAGLAAACSSASQASEEKTQATVIPKVQTTPVEIKELKVTMAVDVLASHSKVFKTKQKINRVAVSDPAVADVVLMTEHQFCVIGKNPGNISVTIWCDNDKASN